MSQSRTAKEIQSYKTKTIIALVIILALISFSIYQYIELQRTNQMLQDSSEVIRLQKEVIAKNDTIAKQKKDLETALSLLSILVSEGDELLPADEVLAGLNEMAEAERQKREDKIARRKELIADIFSSSESKRENARRNILREFSNDTKLTDRVLEAAEGKINMANQNSIYQIIYIFEQISLQSLQDHKDEILAFFTEAENAGLIGPSTAPRVNAIKSRIEI